MANNEKNPNSAWWSAVNGLFYVYGFVGLLGVPIGLAKLCPEAYRIVVVVVAILLSAGVFFGFYLWSAFKLFVRDDPLTGFSQKSASVYLNLSRRVMPDLPERRRNKVVMGIGLSMKMQTLDQVERTLKQQSKFLNVLWKELEREKLFNERALGFFQLKASEARQNLEQFIKVNRPWYEEICKLSNVPSRTIDVLDEIQARYAELSAQMGDMESNLKEERRSQSIQEQNKTTAQWKKGCREEFSIIKAGLQETVADIRNICEKVEESKSHCEQMVDHLK